MSDAFYGIVDTIETLIIPVVAKITGKFSSHPDPLNTRGK